MYQFHKQRVQKVLSSDVNGGLLADEARGCMAFMCTRGAYALILGSRPASVFDYGRRHVGWYHGRCHVRSQLVGAVKRPQDKTSLTGSWSF